MATEEGKSKRDKYRVTVCQGCRNNYYNYQNDGDGWNSWTSGEGCWYLKDIKRDKCLMHTDRFK